jgi:DGQHR domain-containing protein
MGDCGAFSYIREEVPPVEPEELIAFYESCKVQIGVAPDHIISGLNEDWDRRNLRPAGVSTRFAVTLSLAKQFIALCREKRVSFTPLGAIQCWSRKSAIDAARLLISYGYEYIGLGGIVGSRTEDILRLVTEIRTAIPPEAKLHLFGFNRTDHLDDFHALGVSSLDSTAPILRSFKNDSGNYITPEGLSYTAIRVTGLAEAAVGRLIKSGVLDGDQARVTERQALDRIRAVGEGTQSVNDALEAVRAYDELLGRDTAFGTEYERTLRDRPWERCPCSICRELGVEVLLHRGLNRHKRRGIHNLWAFYQRLKSVRERRFMKTPCIRIKQTDGRSIYTFAVNGKEIAKFATVSRVSRSSNGDLVGYQRPEIENHIEEIREYLDGRGSVLANALIIAFNRPLNFVPDSNDNATVAAGTLEVPVDDVDKAGFVVDGQQRFAALRRSQRSDIVVPITAIESAGENDERQLFVLINNTRPLPKSLVYELLPSIGDMVPPRLRTRQAAYRILGILESDPASPFFQRIRTTTSIHHETANIKDVSVLRMIENSTSNGLLGQFPESDRKRANLLVAFWSATRDVFPDAWLLPPRESRLTHGVGIVSLGFLMDTVAFRIKRAGRDWNIYEFRQELERIAPYTAWTSGIWRFGKNVVLPWDGLQNTNRDIDHLTNHLIRAYLGRVDPKRDDAGGPGDGSGSEQSVDEN